MADTPEWRLLDTYETQKFIKDVHDPDFEELFNGSSYELYAHDLPFFNGYAHYQLCNKAVIPYFALDYISNGDNHYYMDGSEHPLEQLIEKDALSLSLDNVLEYVEFHSDVTFYPYRKVKFITEPSKTPYAGASAMGHHFKTLKHHAQFSLSESDEDACFYIRMPVLYNGDTVEGHVQVMKTGEINVLEPVKIPLVDRSRKHEPLHYSHPHAADVLAQNIDFIIQSAEGKRIYETLQNYGCSLQIISGVGNACFAPSAAQGYVVAPQNLETASPYQVISLIGVMRDIELLLLDEGRGDTEKDDPMEVVERNLGRNLDILLKICHIGDELASAGHPEILERFKKSGFEEVYSGYKNNMAMEDMYVLLAQHLNIEITEEA